MCKMQMVYKLSLINQIDNDVRLTKNASIKPFDTVKNMGISTVPNHENASKSLLNLPLLIDRETRFIQYHVVIF